VLRAQSTCLERCLFLSLRFRLFLGPIGALVRRLPVRGWVEGIFDYRAGEVPALLTRAPAAPPRRMA
jgi:hypothetical protein